MLTLIRCYSAFLADFLMMTFAWFGLGSNLSFGLADYFLVNRPTGPFHFFLAFIFFYLLFLPLSRL